MSNPTPVAAPACTGGGCCTRLVRFGVTLAGRAVLHDINLHVHCGELTAFIGPNGAGKTTLLRALIGEVPHTGSLLFHRLSDTVPMKPTIGYVPQRLDFDADAPVSVLDLFAAATSRFPLWLGVRSAHRKAAQESLARVQAGHLIDEKLGRLSGGQLQRVLLALALTPRPALLLLDEPVSGVDPKGIDLFYNMVSDLRRTFDLSILLVTHDLLTAARFADRMIFLNRTILADGAPDAVLAHPLVHQTFGPAAVPARPPLAPPRQACPEHVESEGA
ncbi:MAG: metal ABC transporter ATP-binding protein [Fibrobacterota bacterium]